MATSGEMIRNTAGALSLPQATVTSYFRELQKSGLVAKGGRGRSAGHVSARDVARLLLVLLAADSLADAADALRLISSIAAYSDTGAKAPDELLLEDAVISILEFLAAQAGGPPPKVFKVPGDLSSGNLVLMVSGTRLEAWVHIDGIVVLQFANFGEMPDLAVPPDLWGEVSISDRLRIRAIMGGIWTIRAVDAVALQRISFSLPGVEVGDAPFRVNRFDTPGQ
jgi:hypothetical protein